MPLTQLEITKISDETAANFRLIRDQSGLTQPKFAELLGVSEGSVQSYEKPKRLQTKERARLAIIKRYSFDVVDTPTMRKLMGNTEALRRPAAHIKNRKEAPNFKLIPTLYAVLQDWRNKNIEDFQRYLDAKYSNLRKKFEINRSVVYVFFAIIFVIQVLFRTPYWTVHETSNFEIYVTLISFVFCVALLPFEMLSMFKFNRWVKKQYAR